jgi:heme oxygenase (biliverdin-IX-beta and delta-forming)
MTQQEEHTIDAESILEETECLISQFKTVQLATVNDQGNPEASYTPYIRDAGRYYIFISGLASHTNNLLAHPVLSLFFIQNEDDAKNIFARRRLTLECMASPISRKNEQWNALLDQFQDEHGSTVYVLRSLADFQLFELKPTLGNYVKGFGQAYILEGEDLKKVRQAKGP